MKTGSCILICLSVIFLFCSHATEPARYPIENDVKIELLKRIFQLEVKNNWNYLEINYLQSTGENLNLWSTEEEFYQQILSQDCDIEVLRIGVLSLSTGRSGETDEILLVFLRHHKDGIVQFNAARALAYRGRREGIDLLRNCASGNWVLTSSGFEMNAAALALLILNEKLPKEYLEWHLADPLYIKLDTTS